MVQLNFSSPCPLYPDIPSRCDKIIAAKRGVSAISIICCCFLIFLIYLFRKYEEFSQRMILMLTISALMDCVTYMAGNIYQEGAGCNAQAFFMSYFDWSTLLWVCCITFDLWLVTIKQVKKSKYELVYNCICWIVPLVFSLLPFIGNQYGPAGAWCWIGDNSPGWRLGVWYVPLYILVIAMLITNAYIAIKVYVKANNWAGTFDSTEDRAQLKREVNQLVAYPFIYLVLSIPPFVYRMYSMVHPHEQTHYGLIMATVIAGPALGALNAIAFAADEETLKRLNCAQMKMAFKTHMKSSSAQVIHNYEVDDTASPTNYDTISANESSTGQ